MKRFENFFSFVVIQTKLASVIPFLTGISYAFYVQGKISVKSAFIFFIAMILFDMSATAINNYIGDRTIGQRPHYSDKVSLTIIITFITASALIGIYLTYLHGIIILMTGAVCFAVGIFYTFGPIPIANSAYGEIFAGGVQGFLITFMAAYINLPKDYFITIDIAFPNVAASVSLAAFAKLFMVSMPLIFCIANIMLANNTCDIEIDVKHNRFTLAYYLGRKKSVKLFSILYLITETAIIVSAVIKIIPYTCLLVPLTYYFVRKNVEAFKKEQVKSKTFAFSVRNFVVICVPYFAMIFVGAVILL